MASVKYSCQLKRSHRDLDPVFHWGLGPISNSLGCSLKSLLKIDLGLPSAASSKEDSTCRPLLHLDLLVCLNAFPDFLTVGVFMWAIAQSCFGLHSLCSE